MSADPPELVLEYPCAWTYKVIGSSEDALRTVVAALVGERDHTFAPSRTSRTGRWVSVRLEVVVESDADRTGLLRGLQASDAVRYVL